MADLPSKSLKDLRLNLFGTTDAGSVSPGRNEAPSPLEVAFAGVCFWANELPSVRHFTSRGYKINTMNSTTEIQPSNFAGSFCHS